MKKIILLVIVFGVLITGACSLDYNRVKKGEKPIFTFDKKEYEYANGKVYEYTGVLYKIVDAKEISDFNNVMASFIFKETKSFVIKTTDKIDMQGNITNTQVSGSFYVENSSVKTEYNKAWVDVDENTIIIKNSTKKVTTKESIRSGDIVQVAFKEVKKGELELRGIAKFVVILD